MNPRMFKSRNFTGGTNSYCTEAQAYFNAMTVQLNDTYKGFWNTSILAMIANGTWGVADVICVPCMLTEQQSNLNMKNPTSAIGRLIPNGFGSTFVPKVGYPGVNANSTYFNTGYAPNGNGVNWTLTNAKVSVKLKDNIQDDNYALGVRYNGSVVIRSRSIGDTFDGKVNSASTSVANTNGSGLFSVSTNGTNAYLDRNGTNLITTASTPTDNPDHELLVSAWYDGAMPAPALFCNNTIQFVYAGAMHSNDAAINTMINNWLAL
ncbi:MAG: hypothetical protein ABI241_00465 [Bacteroidia bacterium]